MSTLRVLATSALVALLLFPGPSRAAAPAPAYGARGMVVTSQPAAALAGLAMLERGGNAVDAAVATAFALAVTQPFSAGLGGGAFLLVRLPDGAVVALDARETAPAAATRDMYLQPGVPERASLVGPLAVATPGFVAGCVWALARWGTLSLADVLGPAIALAEEGFPINLYHVRMIEFMRARGLAKLFPETAAIQFPPEETPARPGWRLVQRDLGRTLRQIAEEGPDVFYRGELAASLVEAVRARGGLLTLEDLADYQPVIREPLSGSYRGYTIHAFPPPSSGVTVIEALQVLEGQELAPLGTGSSASIHRIAEAMKAAFADRAAYLGDPAFADVPIARLASRAHADALRARLEPPWWRRPPWRWLDDDYAVPIEAPGETLIDAGTVHLSTADAEGFAVSLTMTINTPYGSGITAEGTGVLLNNEMDDFAKAEGTPNTYGLVDTRGANAIAPGKRPLSSMTPTIVDKDGALFLVTGSPGGPRIISTTLLSLINVIDYGMDVSAAVSAPRFHHQWDPDVLYVEPEVPRDVVEGLRARGHTVEVGERDWSAAEAIQVDAEGVLWGGSDPRRGGLAIGY
jgi:gamma-glutamyltranspeptidase / glutathione hydrolase